MNNPIEDFKPLAREAELSKLDKLQPLVVIGGLVSPFVYAAGGLPSLLGLGTALFSLVLKRWQEVNSNLSQIDSGDIKALYLALSDDHKSRLTQELKLLKTQARDAIEGEVTSPLPSLPIEGESTPPPSPPLLLPPSKGLRLTDNLLAEIIQSSPHIKISGQTGSGKSSLAYRVIETARSLGYGIQLIDPKFPFSRWAITPDYKGLEGSTKGLYQFHLLLEGRLQEAIEIKESGKELPEYPPLLLVIDEIDFLLSESPECKGYLKTLLKVGRGLNLKVLYLGQSPLCSDLGLKKNDFYNSTNIYLGSTIPVALGEVFLSTESKKQLMGEYHQLINDGIKFIALINPIVGNPYLTILPNFETPDRVPVATSGIPTGGVIPTGGMPATTTPTTIATSGSGGIPTSDDPIATIPDENFSDERILNLISQGHSQNQIITEFMGIKKDGKSRAYREARERVQRLKGENQSPVFTGLI